MQEIGLKVMWSPESKAMSIEINGKLTEGLDVAAAMALIRKAMDETEERGGSSARQITGE